MFQALHKQGYTYAISNSESIIDLDHREDALEPTEDTVLKHETVYGSRPDHAYCTRSALEMQCRSHVCSKCLGLPKDPSCHADCQQANARRAETWPGLLSFRSSLVLTHNSQPRGCSNSMPHNLHVVDICKLRNSSGYRLGGQQAVKKNAFIIHGAVVF